jgi:class 3 adenylate cyclase
MSESTAAVETLTRAREAVDTCAWDDALELLTSADDELTLGPEDLARLAEAAWWRGRMDLAIDARERGFAAYIEQGEKRKAAYIALRIARDREHRQSGQANGWFSRAERLLADEPDCVEQGHLSRWRAHRARRTGDLDEAFAHAGKTLELGQKLGDPNLMALGLHDQGGILVEKGQVEEGFAMLDEATVAAVSGELDPHTTAIVYCGIIGSCRDLGDYGRAGDWTEAAKRWCERQSISGFPGVCRVFRAEVMRLRGDWLAAEEEVGLACQELTDFAPDVAKHGFYELGELRLRMGDFEAAEEAFRQSHSLGREPQPGLAQLQLARGDVESALRSIKRGLEDTSERVLLRARMLPAQVEIALAAGDVEMAQAATEELARIAEEYETSALAAAAATARGMVNRAVGDIDGALECLRRSRALWQEVNAPYEAAQARLLLGETYQAHGDTAAAELELRAARDAFDRLGATRDLRKATDLLLAVGHGKAERSARTFLFTDIVESTSLIGAIGDDAWRDLVHWHDRTLRSLFAEHGGEEVDHAGDGFFVAFDSPGSALACARAIQQKLAEHRREAGFAPQVRIGAHATEATQSDGRYSGKGVHEAARVGALAGGGEIVVSASTLEGLEGFPASAPQAVELKGISEPVEVVTLEWR